MKNRSTLDERIAALDDFESEDLDIDEAVDDTDAKSRGRNDFVGQLWDRYGYTSAASRADKADALITAHRMVQKFVDTFSGDRKYRVTFDPSISTAGTDIEGHSIIITPSPIFDPNLTPQQAGIILTAMATHEASHPKYGRTTAAATRRVFGKKRAPNTLSNLLDDVRIERRFAEDYPGYADVFRPLNEYVARKNGESMTASIDDMVNLAVFATRYAVHVEWPDKILEAERDWWLGWADRWAKEDAPRRHVMAVREGLQRIAQVNARRRLEIEKERAKTRTPKMPAMPEPESVKRLKAAFKSLNPLQKKALRMAGQNRSGKEIAAVLGLNLADTKVLIRSARTTIASATRKTMIANTAADMLKGLKSAEGRA